MKLNETIARQIVERTMKIIPYSVNVMDEQGRIIGSGDPSRLQQKHEGAVMTAELIVEQAELMEQVQWDKRHREELVMQLISAEESDEQKLATIAQRLDIDINEPRIATIIKLIALDDNTLTLEHMQHLVHLLEYPERNNLVGDEWNPDKERQRVKSLLKRINKEAGFRVRVAVGDYFPGINGLTRSYQSAKTTLQVTRKLKGTIFFFHDHQLPVLLSAMQYQNWQREKLLTPLLELQKHDDPAKTCQELHIHRNTLRYRLDKINELISLDINKLEDKIHLYLALKLY